ncbi:MAG: hypothetical protein R3B68_15590 [Phycisphaerales bacterium]
MLALRMTPRLPGWGTTDLGAESAGEDARPGDPRTPPMDTSPERTRFGPYRLLRTLDACPAADRLLALHEKRLTSHVVYRFGAMRDAAERRRFVAAVEPLARVAHPHLLPIEEYSFASDGRAWVVTPYTGSQVGLVTLARLVQDKGGQMSPHEATRALTHVLEAVAAAHAAGLVHGPIGADDVLIDRRGSAAIELYGVSRRLRALPDAGLEADEARRDEVRSVVTLGYRLLTGLEPAAPAVSPTKLVKRLDRRWNEFFAAGLGDRPGTRAGDEPAGGFATAEDALDALLGTERAPIVVVPAAAKPAKPATPMRGVPSVQA